MAKKNAFIMYKKDFAASKDYAMKFIKRKGYSVLSQPFKDRSKLSNLPRPSGLVDLMVWYSHGGWDGPTVFEDLSTDKPSQISPSEPVEWVQLMTYFKMQMKPKGVFITHSCHAAGSDWKEKIWEKKRGLPEEKRIWVQDIANHMKIYTIGQAGFAGAAFIPSVKRLLDFAFTGNSKGYPLHAYAPGGIRINQRSKMPKL